MHVWTLPMDYLEQNCVEVKSENVTKLCMRCGQYLIKVREKDYSNIIGATIHLLGESCKDSINRGAALADSNTALLTDKLQKNKKHLSELNRHSEQERMLCYV